MDRRTFLELGATLAGSACFHGFAEAGEAHWGELWDESAPVINPKAFSQLQNSLDGRLLRPSDPGFERLARPNNLRHRQRLPQGIALCQNAQDVAVCLQWAQQQKIPLITRGGGHSYAGFSTTKGLMIHLAEIRDTRFDPSSQTITLGGGLRNAPLYRVLETLGQSTTHGRCPTVGVGGFILGGGIGLDMRRYGLACDNLVSTEMVLANGNIVTADVKNHSDLFWACRGGAGGNFGINTAFTLVTYPVDQCLAFSLSWKSVSDAFLAALFEHLESAPWDLGCKITLTQGTPSPGEPRTLDLSLIGQFVGSLSTFESFFAPILAVSEPGTSDIRELPYWEAGHFLQNPGQPTHYQERSRFINERFTLSLIERIRAGLDRKPISPVRGLLQLFLTGGKTRALTPTETAFVHRRSEWLASIRISWSDGQSLMQIKRAQHWQNAFYRDLVPLCGGGAFQNFADPSLTDWENAYYGENLERLRAIKSVVDPDNVFRFPQSIRPLPA